MKISRPLFFLILLGLILSSVTAIHAEPKKSELKAEVVSLNLVRGKTMFQKEDEKYDPQKDQSTEVKILVTSPDKKILNFKDNDSKLSRFEDEQGNSLINENGPSFWPFVDHYDNKQQCIITIKSSRVPAPQTGKFHLEATLVFQCASGKTATQEAKVTPTAGGSFTLNDTEIKVSDKTSRSFDVSKEDHEKKGHVLLKSSKPLDHIVSIAFFGPDGKKIEHKESDSGSMTFMNKTEYEIGYNLDKKVETYTVKITYYSDAEIVTLPFDQKIGVGM